MPYRERLLHPLPAGHLIQGAFCLAPLQASCDVRDIAEICRKKKKKDKRRMGVVILSE